jgi:small subunit ribosomal protein S9
MSATTKYIETIGRRKTSTARVRLEKAKDFKITINGKSLNEYFKTETERNSIKEPFDKAGIDSHYTISVVVQGGGLMSQSGAVRHGISRALITLDEELRGALKKSGLLKRDPRVKERRKFGLKKARKAPQWSKR